MAALEPQLETQADPTPQVGEAPRFFIELNEPILLFGLNPSGLGMPLMAAAVCAGLGVWTGVLVCLAGSVFLCRKMAKNPTVVNEWVARTGRTRYVVPHPKDGFDPVRVVTPDGAIGPGRWLADHVERGANRPAPKKRVRPGQANGLRTEDEREWEHA